MKSRRIVQRIEHQRWAYYVQRRRFLFGWREVAGPFVSRAAALDATTWLRARDDYKGSVPWEPARIVAPPRTQHYPPRPAGARVPGRRNWS